MRERGASGCKRRIEQLVASFELKEEVTGSNAFWAIINTKCNTRYEVNVYVLIRD